MKIWKDRVQFSPRPVLCWSFSTHPSLIYMLVSSAARTWTRLAFSLIFCREELGRRCIFYQDGEDNKERKAEGETP